MRRWLILSLLLSLPVAAAEPEFSSPGGEFVLRVASDEVKMSHWVDVPYVVKVSDGSMVWSGEFPWSLSQHHWVSSHELELELRKYPGDRPPVRVQLQIDAGTFRAWEISMHGWSDQARPLSGLNTYLDSVLAPP